MFFIAFSFIAQFILQIFLLSRTTTLNFFYFGEDLMRHSVKMNDSHCNLCTNSTDKKCGGPDYMSVYKMIGELVVLSVTISLHTIQLDCFNRNIKNKKNSITMTLVPLVCNSQLLV